MENNSSPNSAPSNSAPSNSAQEQAPHPTPHKKGYMVAQLDEIPAVECPCGLSRRAFATEDNDVATIHLIDIQKDAKKHYHKKLHEIYLVLEGEGFLEVDEERIPVKPLTTVLIKPGCRHRAIGDLKIVNIPVPAFDPSDEWFD